MPCPTLADLAAADALVVVAYDNMQAANQAATAASTTAFNAQSTYFAASVLASSLWLEYLNCNMMLTSGTPSQTGHKIGNPISQVDQLPEHLRGSDLLRMHWDNCVKFEKACPVVAEALRLKARLDRERQAEEATE